MKRIFTSGIIMLVATILIGQSIHHVRTFVPHEKKTAFKKFKRFLFGGDDIVFHPHGVVRLPDGRYVITDTQIPAVVLLNPEGTIEKLIRSVGETPLGMPVGICGDGNGGGYFVDSARRGLVHFDSDFERYQVIVADDAVRFTDVAALGDFLFVVDTEHHQVRVYNKDGIYQFCFGERGAEPGQMNYPTAIAVHDEHVYVLDTMNFRVQVFDGEGNFLSKFGKNGNGGGEFGKPKGLAVNEAGQIFVSDVEFDHVQVFDREGRFLYVLGYSGQGDGQFWMPSGVCAFGSDRLVVADTHNHRLQEFQIRGVEQ